MKKYKAYLIDLDGTMYRGTEKINGASEFVHQLKDASIPYLFLTNNSSKKAEQVAGKLNEMDIPATHDQILTSSMATAAYIRTQKQSAKIYVIGEEGLFHALREEGHQMVEENADFVVVGIDREISYEKFSKACLNVREGATLISTNGDIAIPTERGMLPGNGAISAVISISTGVEPVFIGKPEAVIMDEAIQQMGYAKESVLMVGDNYQTDIMAGIKSGIDTLMVETGVSSFEEISTLDEQPTYKFKNLYAWMEEEGW